MQQFKEIFKFEVLEQDRGERLDKFLVAKIIDQKKEIIPNLITPSLRERQAIKDYQEKNGLEVSPETESSHH